MRRRRHPHTPSLTASPEIFEGPASTELYKGIIELIEAAENCAASRVPCKDLENLDIK